MIKNRVIKNRVIENRVIKTAVTAAVIDGLARTRIAIGGRIVTGNRATPHA